MWEIQAHVHSVMGDLPSEVLFGIVEVDVREGQRTLTESWNANHRMFCVDMKQQEFYELYAHVWSQCCVIAAD